MDRPAAFVLLPLVAGLLSGCGTTLDPQWSRLCKLDAFYSGKASGDCPVAGTAPGGRRIAVPGLEKGKISQS